MKAVEMSENLIEKGIEACRSGAFEEGITYFNRALKKDENNKTALYNRARALSKISSLEKSLADFELLANLEPTNASYIGDYAVSLHLNNKQDEASLKFDLALSIEPNNPYRYSSRAFFKDRLGDLEGAIKDYEKAVELDPEDAIALNNKGLVEEKLGYQDKAKQSFDKSNELVGYKPEVKENTTKPAAKEAEAASAKPSRMKVIKSVFTKEGFKDFKQFSISLLSGNRPKD